MRGGGSLGQAAARRVISAAAGWRAAHDGDVLVVAIDGHGAAGKSTIAAAVAEATGAALVHTDDFFDPRPEPPGPDRSWLGVPPVPVPPDEQDLSGYYHWRPLRAQAVQPLPARPPPAFRRL